MTERDIVEEGMVMYIKDRSGSHWRNYSTWRLFINQGWRESHLIAHTGCCFLFVYEMPNGKNHLHEVSIGDSGMFSGLGQSVSYKRLPLKWRLAEWFGNLEDYFDQIGEQHETPG